MASAHAVSIGSGVDETSERSQPVLPRRTLRWRYRRYGEALTCELALTSEHDAYELRVSPPLLPLGVASELFDEAICAFQRQARLERELFNEGWMLEAFEHGGREAA